MYEPLHRTLGVYAALHGCGEACCTISTTTLTPSTSISATPLPPPSPPPRYPPAPSPLQHLPPPVSTTPISTTSLSATPIQPRPVEPRHVDRAANMACEERSSGRGCGLGGWEGERWERCNARVVACMYDGAVSSHTRQHEAVRDTSLPRPTGTHGNWPAQPATDQLVVDFLESAARAGRSTLPAPLEDAASGGARRWPLAPIQPKGGGEARAAAVGRLPLVAGRALPPLVDAKAPSLSSQLDVADRRERIARLPEAVGAASFG